jgi:hypothetical protein
MITEIWKEIKGYEGIYEVSNLGRIKSLPRYKIRTERISKAKVNVRYRKFTLSVDSIKVDKLVHVLVAQAFVPNPFNKNGVNHKDGDTWNNRADNLEWCTQGENNEHAKQMGLHHGFGETHYRSKLTESQAIEILKMDLPYKEIAKKYDVPVAIISCLKRGVTWSRITGIKYNRVKKKLPVEQIISIYLSSKKVKDLCKIYDISRSSICDIKNGKSYLNITELLKKY